MERDEEYIKKCSETVIDRVSGLPMTNLMLVIIDDATQQAMVWQYKDWKEFLVAAMDCEVEKLVWFPVGQIATRCDEPDDKQ